MRNILTDDMEHVIHLTPKGHASAWTDNNLKFINPLTPHQICILYRFLNHVMDLRQNNIDEAVGLKMTFLQHPLHHKMWMMIYWSTN